MGNNRIKHFQEIFQRHVRGSNFFGTIAATVDAIQVATQGALPEQVCQFVQFTLIPFMLLKEGKDNFLFYIHRILFLFEFDINRFHGFPIIPPFAAGQIRIGKQNAFLLRNKLAPVGRTIYIFCFHLKSLYF